MLLVVCSKKDHQSYFCDNLCYKTTSENRILVLLVVCGVKRHAKIFASLPSKEILRKSTKFSMILLNVSQENHRLNFQILKLSSGYQKDYLHYNLCYNKQSTEPNNETSVMIVPLDSKKFQYP